MSADRKPCSPADPSRRPANQSDVRRRNLALLSRLIFEADAAPSRADLTISTGLGRATVSRLVQDLIAGGLVQEEAPGDSPGRGRPATPLAPARGTIAAIGLETNVHFVAGRAIDLTGATLSEFRLSGFGAFDDPAKTLSLLGDSAATMALGLRNAGVRIAGAALAIPGLVNTRDNGLLVAPNLDWSDFNPIDLLGDRWHECAIPTRARNDADLQSLAAAYARPGRVRTRSTFLYLAGDIGIGGALVRDGGLTRGDHGWAGEIGHVTVDPDGPPCACGSRGCLEAYAGQASVLLAAGLPADSTAEELIERADAEDGCAISAIERAGWALGIAISDVINVLDVAHIIFGTSLGRLLPKLRPALEEGLRARVLGLGHRGVELVSGPAIDSPACTGGAFDVLQSVVCDPAIHMID